MLTTILFAMLDELGTLGSIAMGRHEWILWTTLGSLLIGLLVYRMIGQRPLNVNCRSCGEPVAKAGDDLCVRCDDKVNRGRN